MEISNTRIPDRENDTGQYNKNSQAYDHENGPRKTKKPAYTCYLN